MRENLASAMTLLVVKDQKSLTDLPSGYTVALTDIWFGTRGRCLFASEILQDAAFSRPIVVGAMILWNAV